MVKKDIPFYPNTPDDTHCYQACIKMILKANFPDREYSWEELEQTTAKVPGMATWPMAGLVWMQKLGFDVINIEAFDYNKFLTEKDLYVIEFWGKEAGEWALRNTDIAQEFTYTRELLSSPVKMEVRLPELVDLKNFLDKGYVCICSVNSRALNNKDGIAGHSVLVIGYDENGLMIHDPGLPAVESRYVMNHDFIRAWTSPTENFKALMAFRLNH